MNLRVRRRKLRSPLAFQLLIASCANAAFLTPSESRPAAAAAAAAFLMLRTSVSLTFVTGFSGIDATAISVYRVYDAAFINPLFSCGWGKSAELGTAYDNEEHNPTRDDITLSR
jgi:hypothetical protein